MTAPAKGRNLCTHRLSLLYRWLKLSEEYSRVFLATVNAKSKREREFLRIVIDDVKAQMDTLREQLDLHRGTHGC